MTKIHYRPDMVCPYCGNSEFFIKQRYSGQCEYNMRFDMNNGDVENGEMYTYASFKTVGKYAYCNNCRKRLFPVSELPYDHI